MTTALYSKRVSRLATRGTFKFSRTLATLPNRRMPLVPTGVLQQFEQFDNAPLIGTEFPKAQLADWISAPNSDELLSDLAIKISQRNVVFFRKQDGLTNDLQKKLVQRLGELTGKPKTSGLHIHPVINPNRELGGDDPEISTISSKQMNRFFPGLNGSDRAINRQSIAAWHSDIQAEPVPADYTSLRLVELPTTGGDTIWASGYEVYDRLSPAFRTFLEGLTANFDSPFFTDTIADIVYLHKRDSLVSNLKLSQLDTPAFSETMLDSNNTTEDASVQINLEVVESQPVASHQKTWTEETTSVENPLERSSSQEATSEVLREEIISAAAALQVAITKHVSMITGSDTDTESRRSALVKLEILRKALMCDAVMEIESTQKFDTFTCFSLLPLEIRRKVWHGASRMPRLIALDETRVDLSTNMVAIVQTSRNCQPAVLQVSKEAREEALRVYTLNFGTTIGSNQYRVGFKHILYPKRIVHAPPVYVNWVDDVFYMSRKKLDYLFHHRHGAKLDDYLPTEIRSIALDVIPRPHDRYHIHLLERQHYPSLQEILLLVRVKKPFPVAARRELQFVDLRAVERRDNQKYVYRFWDNALEILAGDQKKRWKEHAETINIRLVGLSRGGVRV